MSFPILGSYPFPYQAGLPVNINLFNPYMVNQNVNPAIYVNNIADFHSDSSDSNR